VLVHHPAGFQLEQLISRSFLSLKTIFIPRFIADVPGCADPDPNHLSSIASHHVMATTWKNKNVMAIFREEWPSRPGALQQFDTW
jgi:hypothetical protein